MKKINVFIIILSLILVCSFAAGCSKSEYPKPAEEIFVETDTEHETQQKYPIPEMTEEEKRLAEIEGYLASLGYKTNDIIDNGESKLFDKGCYTYSLKFAYESDTYGIDGIIYQMSEAPYEIYRGYENSELFLVWKDGGPKTDEQERMEYLAPTLKGMDVETKYSLITKERDSAIHADNWRELGELQPECQDIIYIAERKNFYQVQYDGDTCYGYIHGSEIGTSDNQWFWIAIY